MPLKIKFAALFAVAAMLPAPTAALAEGPTYAPAPAPTHPKKPMPGPGATLPEKAKAYGVYCKTFPRKGAKGAATTPFSRCVTAMAMAAKTKKTPQIACKSFSKEVVKGQGGSEFTRCAAGATKVKKRVLEARG